MIEELPPMTPDDGGRRPAGAGGRGDGHPLRGLTRQIAFEGAWSGKLREQFAATFDAMAPTWPTGDWLDIEAQLDDALGRGVRGLVGDDGDLRHVVDLGGGNGRASGVIRSHLGGVVVADVSIEMLWRVPRSVAPGVLADGACLPFADNSLDVVVAANMFLFPAEMHRVLREGGLLVWINSQGADAPIHLSAHEVDSALPGEWSGVCSMLREANWSVHRMDG